jgi:hypothetical protein
MRFILLPLALLLAAPLSATPSDLRSVAGMQFHNRVLLVFAPSLRDPRLIAQRTTMAKAVLEAATRDLVMVQVADGQVIGAHDQAERLRRRFHVPPDAYRTLLIGKDGKVARTAPAPINAASIMRAIDTMPTRREEVRRAHAGLGRAAP